MVGLSFGAVDITPAQERTLNHLIGRGPAAPADPGLADRVRADIEARLEDAGIVPGIPPIWLGKHRLNDKQRCEGFFDAGMQREGPAFEHSSRTAVGALLHKAIEIDIATERGADPATVCHRAAERLTQDDQGLDRFWVTLDAFDRAETVADAGRHLWLFRESFPPLQRRWAPQPELHLKARLAVGSLVLSGTPDLVLGRSRRLALDFKTGGAWPEHAEDMRFYALLLLLRTGVPPYRVATFFLDSGEWQPEDVTPEMVGRAADRVVDAACAAEEIRRGRAPALTPGPYCDWCPRRPSCPAARAAFQADSDGETTSVHGLLLNGTPTYGSLVPSAPTSGDGATVRRNVDGEGPVPDRPDPSIGRGPPPYVRAGHPARAVR